MKLWMVIFIGSREAIATIIDPKAFIIVNSKRFEVQQAQADALAKADAILSLSGPTREEWQPIETAPKDGSHILAYRLPVGIRTTNNTHPPTVVLWFDDGFYTSVNELAPERPFDATHWRPLPAPPALTRPDGGGAV